MSSLYFHKWSFGAEEPPGLSRNAQVALLGILTAKGFKTVRCEGTPFLKTRSVNLSTKSTRDTCEELHLIKQVNHLLT